MVKIDHFLEVVLNAINPDTVFRPHLRELEPVIKKYRRFHIYGLGKAASHEALAIHQACKELSLLDNLKHVVSYTTIGNEIDSDVFSKQISGDHPHISQHNLEMTGKFIKYLSTVDIDHLLIFALSGGGSALLEKPKEGVDFSEISNTHQRLLNSSANINAINHERAKLSDVKDGGLLKYVRAGKIIQFINCDIPNGDLSAVSSGPLYPKEIPEKMTVIKGQSAEFILENMHKKLHPHIQIGKVYDCTVDELVKDLINELEQKRAILSGGEGTVLVPPFAGKGGRNTHFCLLMAFKLYQDIRYREHCIISIGTDGADGATDAAGAYLDYETFSTNMDFAKMSLDNFDSYHFFKKVGTLITTGKTPSNVMDLRYVGPKNLLK